MSVSTFELETVAMSWASTTQSQLRYVQPAAASMVADPDQILNALR